MSNKSIDFVTKTQRMNNFEMARKLAMHLDVGRYKRAKASGTGVGGNTYSAIVNLRGERFVMGDSMVDVPHPTSIINGRPAVRIYSYTTPLKLS